MESAFEPLEADFARYYGVDLRMELYGPEPIGVRRLLALIRGLPPDCAFARSLTSKAEARGEIVRSNGKPKPTTDVAQMQRFFGRAATVVQKEA